MDLLLSLDPGTSMTKMVYRIVSEVQYKPESFFMEPELFKTSGESLDLYESGRINIPSPENEAWVEYEQEFYAVGFLAKKYFEARVNLLEIKHENAIPKVLAAVGAIATREGLGNNFTLSLALLLPYGEWEGRERLHRALITALSNFKFRGQEFCVKLGCFECMPEGAGLVLTRSKKLGADFNQMKIAVLMLGFRDISVVLFERGLSTGASEKLGLAWLLEKIKNKTSGQNLEDLLKAVHQSGSTPKLKFFKSLAKTKKAELKAEEIAQIMSVVTMLRKEYWQKVSDWLSRNLTEDIEQIIIGGGTSEYLASELKSFFSHTQISWAAELEEDVRLAFSLSLKDALCLRFTDVYGLFRYLQTLATYSEHVPTYQSKECQNA